MVVRFAIVRGFGGGVERDGHGKSLDLISCWDGHGSRGGCVGDVDGHPSWGDVRRGVLACVVGADVGWAADVGGADDSIGVVCVLECDVVGGFAGYGGFGGDD